jgi:hypothetical protein
MDSGPLVQASNPVIRELQPTQNLELGRLGARFYPDLPPQESAIGDSIRDFAEAKMGVDLVCLVTIFSVVAIASLKMTPVYDAEWHD